MYDNAFGEYLRHLIKDAGMTQVQFYMALGITKPYFYDIISGKASPPPPKLQFKSMEILNADKETCTTFFDLAAGGRNEIPADVASWMNTHPGVINNIRRSMKKQII